MCQNSNEKRGNFIFFSNENRGNFILSSQNSNESSVFEPKLERELDSCARTRTRSVGTLFFLNEKRGNFMLYPKVPKVAWASHEKSGPNKDPRGTQLPEMRQVRGNEFAGRTLQFQKCDRCEEKKSPGLWPQGVGGGPKARSTTTRTLGPGPYWEKTMIFNDVDNFAIF